MLMLLQLSARGNTQKVIDLRSKFEFHCKVRRQAILLAKDLADGVLHIFQKLHEGEYLQTLHGIGKQNAAGVIGRLVPSYKHYGHAVAKRDRNVTNFLANSRIKIACHEVPCLNGTYHKHDKDASQQSPWKFRFLRIAHYQPKLL